MKAALIAFAASLIILTGCEKIDELTQFNLEYTESVVIPTTPVVNLPISISTPDITTNIESQLAAYNTSTDLIEEISLTQFDLTLTAPDTSELSFFKSVEVFINAEGLAETRIAWSDNVPDNVGQTLELETTTSDMKQYVLKDAFSLRISVETDKAINPDHEIDIYTKFFVDAKILGQ